MEHTEQFIEDYLNSYYIISDDNIRDIQTNEMVFAHDLLDFIMRVFFVLNKSRIKSLLKMWCQENGLSYNGWQNSLSILFYMPYTTITLTPQVEFSPRLAIASRYSIKTIETNNEK